MSVSGKHIVVGVSGGIAAYKSVEVVREFVKRGAKVRVVMTPSATRFVGAVTFAGITSEPVLSDLWDPSYRGEAHVDLASWADAIVVVPATANTLARAANALADDALSATLLCAKSPVIYAPAMHYRMWSHPANAANISTLTANGAHFVGPVDGPLASGESGMGRLADPSEIVDATTNLLNENHDLVGRTIVISAGPTVEDIDPVRFLGNRSSGKMGFALASRARARGAKVILVAGPVTLPTPIGVDRVDVRSALEMQAALETRFDSADAIIMSAAVSDYRAAHVAPEKLKKQGEKLQLELIRNPDILAGLGERRTERTPILVGFAVETNDIETYARQKVLQKKVDFVVANEASQAFAGDFNLAHIVDKSMTITLERMSKHALADVILNRVVAELSRD